MKLSIIIPCFNEESTVKTLVESVQASQVDIQEIIVVDDGSVDNTLKILHSMKSDNLIIKTHKYNKGKGAALRTGFQAAKGDICLVQDADLEYDPKEYSKLIQPILDDKADVVFGSRFQGGYPHRVVYFWHRIGNGFLTLLSNIFTDLNLTDIALSRQG